MSAVRGEPVGRLRSPGSCDGRIGDVQNKSTIEALEIGQDGAPPETGTWHSFKPNLPKNGSDMPKDNTGVNVLRPDHLFRLDLAAERAQGKLYDADSLKDAALE